MKEMIEFFLPTSPLRHPEKWKVCFFFVILGAKKHIYKKKNKAKQFHNMKRFAKQSVWIIPYVAVFGRIVLQNDLEVFRRAKWG